MSRDPLWVGIQKHGAGYRALVSRGKGRSPLTKHFPASTPPQVMQAWRQDQQASRRLQRRTRAAYGTLAGDAKRYLASVKAMPTYRERERDIRLWVTIFGARDRERITSAEIRAIRDQWLTEPRGYLEDGTPLPPLAPGTVNKRLRALANLWTVLDGKRAPNPVRDVPEAKEPRDVARALDYPTIDAILAAMPDRGSAKDSVKGKRPAASKSKARLRVLAYTGWPSSVLQQLRPADVNLDAGLAKIPPRKKGAGMPAVIVPLLPQAVDALKEFARLNCWGTFSASSLRKSFQRAVATVLPDVNVRVYDLRHSALSLFAQTGDERAVQYLAQHADLKTTKQYTVGSVPARVQAVLHQASERLKR